MGNFVLDCSTVAALASPYFRCVLCLIRIVCGRVGTPAVSIFWKRRYNRKRRHQVFRGGVTASTEMLAARRHTGAHSPVSGAKTIIANTNQLAYAA